MPPPQAYRFNLPGRASVINAPAGGGGAHNNMPPTMMVNDIMRELWRRGELHTRRNENQRALSLPQVVEMFVQRKIRACS
jgi:hypothetical protein